MSREPSGVRATSRLTVLILSAAVLGGMRCSRDTRDGATIDRAANQPMVPATVVAVSTMTAAASLRRPGGAEGTLGVTVVASAIHFNSRPRSFAFCQRWSGSLAKQLVTT